MPIILLTAHSRRQSVVEARVRETLVKPVIAKDLLARIETIIYNPRPFVDVPGYFGPCRRRKLDTGYHGVERRARALEAVSEHKLLEIGA